MYLDKSITLQCLFFILPIIWGFYLTNKAKFYQLCLKFVKMLFKVAIDLSKVNIVLSILLIVVLAFIQAGWPPIAILLFGLAVCLFSLYGAQKFYKDVSQQLDETIFI